MADRVDIENDPVMLGHLAMAGIEPDAPAGDTKTADVTSAGDTKTDDKTVTPSTDTKTTTVDTKTSDKQTVDGKDSSGVSVDSGTKQGDQTKAEQITGNPRDLTLPDGSIVKGGAERRFYETSVVQRQRAEEAMRQVETLTASLTAAQQRASTLETSMQTMQGVKPEVALSAVRLYTDLQRNPVATVTKLLAELKADGHNFDGIGGAVDTNAISLMLAQRDNAANTKTGPTAEDINAASASEVGQFFARFPDAVLHDEVLGQILTKNPSVDLTTAYFQLKTAAIAQGFDWSQPLGPQVEARRTGQQPAAIVGDKTGETKVAPLVNGRVAPLETVVLRDKSVAAEGETYSDIIRAAMRENGFSPQ